MIMGALMGKKYPLRKYINVSLITVGVALFMGGGDSKHGGDDADKMGPTMIIGVALLFVSLSFDGATGAYEDMIMSTAHVGPFELMYNIQLGKCILAGLGLIFTNEVPSLFNSLLTLAQPALSTRISHDPSRAPAGQLLLLDVSADGTGARGARAHGRYRAGFHFRDHLEIWRAHVLNHGADAQNYDACDLNHHLRP
jgi:hypothetical protein